MKTMMRILSVFFVMLVSGVFASCDKIRAFYPA